MNELSPWHPFRVQDAIRVGQSYPVEILTFDLFGTVLDLWGSLAEPIDIFLTQQGSPLDRTSFWAQWRDRQRIEQYQDSLLMLGHSGYLEACRRALLYTLRQNRIAFTTEQVEAFMQVWQELRPFEDAVAGLNRLRGSYRLVALSNGEQWFLEHLVKNRIRFEFDSIISVQSAGFFKPHPSVYRTAARLLGAEPAAIMMVASHAFDVMGARACGFRGAYVNRYDLPYEETPFQPDVTLADFHQLADYLLEGIDPAPPASPGRQE